MCVRYRSGCYDPFGADKFSLRVSQMLFPYKTGDRDSPMVLTGSRYRRRRRRLHGFDIFTQKSISCPASFRSALSARHKVTYTQKRAHIHTQPRQREKTLAAGKTSQQHDFFLAFLCYLFVRPSSQHVKSFKDPPSPFFSSSDPIVLNGVSFSQHTPSTPFFRSLPRLCKLGTSCTKEWWTARWDGKKRRFDFFLKERETKNYYYFCERKKKKIVVYKSRKQKKSTREEE